MHLSKALLYLVYAVVVAGLIVAIVLSFHTSKPKTTTPPARPSTGTHQQTSPRQGTQPKTTTPSTPSGTPSTGQAGTSGTSSTGTPGTGSQLSNTGPGDTALIFVAVSALGALAFRRFQILKQA